MNNRPVDDSSKDWAVRNTADLPLDTIGDIQFPKNGPCSTSDSVFFSASSWDSTMRIYQTNNNDQSIQQRVLFKSMEEDPIISSCWSPDGMFLCSGSTTGKLKIYDAEKGTTQVLGNTGKPIAQVFWIMNNDTPIIITTEFGRVVSCWTTNQGTPVASSEIPSKCLASHIEGRLMAIGSENNSLAVFNLELLIKSPQAIKFTKNPLEAQINSVCLKEVDGVPKNCNDPWASNPCSEVNAKKLEILLGTIDGRANISTLVADNTNNFTLNSTMTFKCHRVDASVAATKKNTLYPVNSVGYNCRSPGFMMTAGGEGIVNFWDIPSKNKIKSFLYNKVPVSCAGIDPKGRVLVYALGYDWAQGVWGLTDASIPFNPRVYVHLIPDSELRYSI